MAILMDDRIYLGFLKQSRSTKIKPCEPSKGEKPPPHCIVDGHAHIMSGRCTPMPLLRNQIGIDFKRETIEKYGAWRISPKRKLILLQEKKTVEIGDEAYKNNNTVFGEGSSIQNSELYKSTELQNFMVILMMDMEFAHIEGYNGTKIYQNDKLSWYYYKRKNGIPKDIGDPLNDLGNEDQLYEGWIQQWKYTVDAIRNNPFRLIGMFHYDPRRYKKDWSSPFNEVATKKTDGLFIGFKMYTPLGYKPLDKRLKHMKDFYKRCASKGIPIIVHCSKGGMITHDSIFYKEFDKGNKEYSYYYDFDIEESVKNHPGVEPNKWEPYWYHIEQKNKKKKDYISYDKLKSLAKEEEDYFIKNYIHPEAWEKVLNEPGCENLKICLAHFGGNSWDTEDEEDKNWIKTIIELTKKPNVYTDFSCWGFDKKRQKAFKKVIEENAHLKNKILFGTDWYMTMIGGFFGEGYEGFTDKFWDFFNDKEFKDGKDLWQKFTFINPFEFFGFNDMAKMNHHYSALLNIEADDKIHERYEQLKKLQKFYSDLKALLK
jgi:hypothetical protein